MSMHTFSLLVHNAAVGYQPTQTTLRRSVAHSEVFASSCACNSLLRSNRSKQSLHSWASSASSGVSFRFFPRICYISRETSCVKGRRDFESTQLRTAAESTADPYFPNWKTRYVEYPSGRNLSFFASWLTQIQLNNRL